MSDAYSEFIQSQYAEKEEILSMELTHQKCKKCGGAILLVEEYDNTPGFKERSVYKKCNSCGCIPVEAKQ